MIRTMSIATLFTTLAGGAQAQWVNNTEEDPFGDKKNSISMTIAGGYGFGFRCNGAAEYALVYLTTEKASSGAASMNLMSPKLKLRIDDKPVIDLDAKVDNAGGKLRLSAAGPSALGAVKEISSATKRVAVAVEIAGTRLHTQSFGVSGSRSTIAKAIAACEIPID
jgi:hypothetical protein